MTPLEKLVLFDPSDRGRQSLHFGFERDGVSVHTCDAIGKLVDLCERELPELVVLALPETQRGVTEILGVVDALKGSDEVGHIPILLLGDRELREQALKTGADEFVPRPAYLRDVLTLARLVVAQKNTTSDRQEIRALVEEYGLYFLIRALGLVGRSAILELERAGRYGEIHCVLGEVSASRVGKVTGVSAFNHLMLWHDARLRLRLESPVGDRKIFVPTPRLLEDASRFAQKFEQLSSKVGGSRTTYKRVVSRAVELRTQVPSEIEQFSHLFDGRRTIVDIAEEAPFKPLDVIKITHRLIELGAIERATPVRASDEASVYDWLKGDRAAATQRKEDRATVTEAGRRAAEAYAERDARPYSEPSDDLLPQANLLQRLGEAGEKSNAKAAAVAASHNQQPQHGKHKKKKGRHHEQPAAPDPVAVTAKPTNGATPHAPHPVVAATAPPALGNGKSATETPLPAGKLLPEAVAGIAAKENVFDAVEDEFFAREAELQRVDPVETFDDLDAAHAGQSKSKQSGNNRWSLMSLFRTVPAKSAPAAKPSTSTNSSTATKPAAKPATPPKKR